MTGEDLTLGHCGIDIDRFESIDRFETLVEQNNYGRT